MSNRDWKTVVILLMFTVAAVLAACSSPASAAETVKERVAALRPAEGPAEQTPGAFVTFDEQVASGITREEVPPIEPAEGEEMPWWALTPAYTQFTLNDYAVEGAFHTPRVYAYPVEAYKAMNSEAAARIEQLEQLLVEQPAVVAGDMPFLPLFNAAQMIRAQVEYLSFEGGSGVRYLTQYGQDLAPVNNMFVFYTFQGLTDDGQTYIAAVLPVTHPDLPDDPSGGAMTEEMATYFAEAEQQLNAAPDDTFTPSLAALDAAMRSLSPGALAQPVEE